MCLIAYKEKENGFLTNRHFKNMITRNPDGFGVMYREGGRVQVRKILGSARDKFKMFQDIRQKDNWAIHARIKTHGLIDETNCHPYKIMDRDDGDPIDLYMMHNGTIGAAPEIDKSKSDTWHYVEYVLKPLFKIALDFVWDNEHMHSMIAKHVGSSKLLFMRSDEVDFPILIINAEMGTEKNGCWLSNAYSCDMWGSHRTHYVGHNNVANQNDADYAKKKAEELEEAFGWSEYCENRQQKFKEKTLENGGKIYLPDNSKDDKIVELKDFTGSITPTEIVDQQLLDQLMILRGMSDYSIKEFVVNDPDTTADIILYLYAKNTMPYETIIDQINDVKGHGLADIVSLLRQMTVDEDRKRIHGR